MDMGVRKGMPVAALYQADNLWYRAVICQVLSASQVLVFYVDYGNTESANVVNLRPLTVRLYTLFYQLSDKKNRLAEGARHEI